MTINYAITSAIDTAIATMTSPTYNHNYTDVNEYRVQDKSYPAVKTTYKQEDYLDPDEQMVDSYTAELIAVIEVTVDNTVTSPQDAISRVVEDFQRLFESIHPTLCAAGWIKADLLKDEREYSQIRKRPGKVTMEWEVMYRVKRSNPAVTI